MKVLGIRHNRKTVKEKNGGIYRLRAEKKGLKIDSQLCFKWHKVNVTYIFFAPLNLNIVKILCLSEHIFDICFDRRKLPKLSIAKIDV